MKVRKIWILKHLCIIVVQLSFAMLQNYPSYLTPEAITSLNNIAVVNHVQLLSEYNTAVA